MAKAPKVGERTCPKCKEVIKVNAEICKHCHTEFSAEEVKAAKSENRKLMGFGCLGLLLLLGFCSYVVSDDSNSEAPMEEGAAETEGEIPEEPTENAKKDVVAFYHDIKKAAQSCNMAKSAATKAANEGNPFAAYQAVDAMGAQCLSASSAIEMIEVPKSVGKKALETLIGARKTCADAYVSLRSFADAAKSSMEDSESVEKQSAATSIAEATGEQIQACEIELVTTAVSLGATPDEF